MKKILILLIVISLFLLEGCSLIGFGIGSMIPSIYTVNIEEIESAEKDSWLAITFKDNEVMITVLNDSCKPRTVAWDGIWKRKSE